MDLLQLVTLDNIIYIGILLAKIIGISLPVMLCVAYLVYAERKVIGWMQLRHGPTMVGPFGLLQPIADAMKLMFKEIILPSQSSKVVFLIAPLAIMVPALIAWAAIPFSPGIVLADLNLGVMYILATSSLGVYGVLMAGWASNSKYAFLGAVRSGAQMISYEVSMGLCILSVVLITGSMNLSDIVTAQTNWWYALPLFPMFVVFIISILAETNRAPFDLPEAEAELVAGYNVEYASMPFALFFLGEYANMILMSAFTSVLFLGGWLPPVDMAWAHAVPGFVWLAAKIAFVLFIFLWARATFPRFRYDQLMRLGWKILLPFTFGWFILTAFFVKFVMGY